MAGLQHVFITGVRADTEVQYPVPSRSGIRYQDLHHRQSLLDASCGILSVLEAAMVLCGIPRHQVEGIASAKRDPLRKLWQLARDFYFEGVNEGDIKQFVAAFSPRLNCDVLRSSRPSRIGLTVMEAVQAGQVPILRFESRRVDHFAMVIGYEIQTGETAPRALLLLDVADSAPWTAFHNCRIELQTRAGASVRAKPPYNLPCRYLSGEAWAVRLKSVVVVKRAQPP